MTIQPEVTLGAPVALSPAQDEAALIRAAQRGDHDAFAQLVRAHDQAVLRLALNLLRNPEDARDVYQEVFLRAYRNLGQFRFQCRFHTWVYRIAANLCLDQLRRRRVRKEQTAAPGGQTEAGRLDTLPDRDSGRDPERHVLSKEAGERIEAALGILTPRERMVFQLRHFEGMRLKAIGEILGASEEAAKNCLFRATQKMRAALGDLV